MKCDHCRRVKYPVFYHFRFGGREWSLCPACCRSLLTLMRHKAAVLVRPERKSA